jgi:hypothetical protein
MPLWPFLWRALLWLNLASAAFALPIDHPAPLQGREVRVEVDAKESLERYYRFTAGPGTLSLVLDMETASGTMIDFEAQILDDRGQGLAKVFDVLGNSQSKRQVKDLKLKKTRTLLLKIVAKSSWGTGSCRVRLEGPVVVDERRDARP